MLPAAPRVLSLTVAIPATLPIITEILSATLLTTSTKIMIISTIIMITSVRFMTISTRIMTTSNILLIVFVNLPDYRGKCSDHCWRAPDHHRLFVSDETCFRIGRYSHPYRKVRASASDDTRGRRWSLRGYLRSWSHSVRLPLQRRQAAIDG